MYFVMIILICTFLYIFYVYIYVCNIDYFAICICMDFEEGPMADERKLNGSPSINKDYYYIVIIIICAERWHKSSFISYPNNICV